MIKNDYDLVVVGGGPGGTTLATLVAKQGHRVVLVERESFPRYQIGESLLPSTVHIICSMLGVSEELQQAGFVRKRGGTFSWGKHPKPWTFSFSDSSLTQSLGLAEAFQVERAKFDDILLNNARRNGVEVHEQCPALRTLVDKNGRINGIEVQDCDQNLCKVYGRYIADASGHASPLYRSVGRRIYSEFFQNLAWFGYFRNGKRLEAPNEGNILTAAFEDGWFWYIPLSDSLTSVGLVLDKKHGEHLKEEQIFYEYVAKCPLIADLLKGATRETQGMYGKLRVRKDYSYCTERFWSKGMLLIGDSACFVDPVFSTGVHLATYGGLLAARSINTSLSGQLKEARCMSEFQRRYREEFQAQLRFLMAFYDMNQQQDHYFWQARSILGTAEQDNEAFIRLVSGAGTTVTDFFHSLRGSGQTFSDQVQSLSGINLADLGNSSDFAFVRTDGSARDLIPPRLCRKGEIVHGSTIPGQLIPSENGRMWQQVREDHALQPNDELHLAHENIQHRLEQKNKGPLLLRCGSIEICFEDEHLIAFGLNLIKHRRFIADEARSWARFGEFSWEDLRKILDELLANGVLTRNSSQAIESPRL